MSTYFPSGPPNHLYVHWPFCKNKCHYCDFVALEGHNQFQTSYHQSLCTEVQEFFALYTEKKKWPVSTFYMGGGTPSLYPLGLMREFFTHLNSFVSFTPNAEVTLEVNPGGITTTHLQTWREIGFNRMSVGVQVLNDEVLASLNRHQSNADVYELMELAPTYFENISVDLIMGLPGVTDEIWQDTLERVVQFPIKHVSVYFLTVHDKTPLYFKVRKGKLRLLSDEKMIELYESVATVLESHGFVQYETSNYARPGWESLHNQAYWDRVPYKGFGLGAASFDGVYRLRNEKNLTRHVNYWSGDRCQRMVRSSPKVERITTKQAFLEALMLGLRQKKGLDVQNMISFLALHEADKFVKRLSELQKLGYLHREGSRVYLTRKGMALENELVLQLA